jgi:hypothetical protein
MYAAAFVTPAVALGIMSFRSRFAAEYLSMGLNLLAGGFLPIVGTLWTNISVPAERQVNVSSAGTWIFFIFFFATGMLGMILTITAIQLSNKAHQR